ncbi:hypothetical protein R1sor_025022 [Riccia sorocarpa]|uniref:Uncharacterized protein n=1 Tax=Riccia sorocarpa TaxID=122646 RepID=A0ABD3G9D6_9MARC
MEFDVMELEWEIHGRFDDSDDHDSDHSPFHAERLSGNTAAHDIPEFASFIPFVAGDLKPDRASSDPPLEGIGSNCLYC